MNYMRILLIYMASVMSLAVQSTSAPVETPEPTPTAIVAQQAEKTPAAETEAPAVTETPAAPGETPAPVPEITPNRNYHNLKKGDKGKDVKALQERLIELGYLPEGSADGSYGNQTYKAVREFQYYNGLNRDGIAGDRTQTYLFENPDVNPFPTATPAPTDTPEPEATGTPEAVITPEEIPETTPTAVPTEEPAEPTEKPEAEPTEEPAEEPTEKPEAEPTEEPAEEPTEKPEAEPTEEPEDEPTEEPTEELAEPTKEPAPTPERTASAPVTSAPATEAPISRPTMSVEEIDPEELHFSEATGSVAFNETGAPLSWLALEDGVQILRKPRLQLLDEQVRISLDDLAACLDSWVLTDDGNTVVLEAEGHTLALLNEASGVAATVDAKELSVTDADFDFGEGHFIDAEFLASALNGEAVWVEEENTLMLRIPEAE